MGKWFTNTLKFLFIYLFIRLSLLLFFKKKQNITKLGNQIKVNSYKKKKKKKTKKEFERKVFTSLTKIQC